MGTWLVHEMTVRVAAQWAVRTASVFIDPRSLAWDADRPSSERVAMMFLAYRERKDKTPGKRKLDMKNFLREEGTKTVTSPLTGEKVKLKTLTGPKYQEDPKSKDLLNKLFSEWRDKNKGKDEGPAPEEEAPESKQAPPEKAPTVEAPPVVAPEVKAPPVEAPDVQEAPGGAAPAKKDTPSQEPSEQDMQEAYDPYLHSRGEPGVEAPAKPQAPGAPKAPPREVPSTDVPESRVEVPEPPSAPDVPEVPEPDLSGKKPEAPAETPEVPEPDLSGKKPEAPAETPKETRGKIKSILDALRGKELTPEELQALDDFDTWLRDLAGLEEREKKEKKTEKGGKPQKATPVPIPQFRPDLMAPAITVAVKSKIKPEELTQFQTFALNKTQESQEKAAPKNDVKTRHHIPDDDEKAIDRVRQSFEKKHRTELAKYNRTNRQYERDKAEADKATAEVNKQHDTLRSELEAGGESKETFDSAHSFSKRMEKRQQVQMVKWEKARDKAEAEGAEPPLKPEPVDAHVEWLKDHKSKWEDQPEATRGEYKPPMVTREMFDKILKAPAMPEQPEPPPDPPAPPSAKAIRQEIEDSDPDLAETLKDVSDADFEVLVKPTDTKSVAEMKAEFIDNTDDPDLKKRVMEMDPDDFEALLAALNPDSPKKGKRKGSLTEWTLRLAYARPDLREHLLWAVTSSLMGGR